MPKVTVQDVITEAAQVGELFQMLLQVNSGKMHFIKRREETEHIGVQGGRPGDKGVFFRALQRHLKALLGFKLSVKSNRKITF